MGAEFAKFSHLSKHLPEAQLVISATSAPHKIIEKEDVVDNVSDEGIVVVDLANPADVDGGVEEVEDVTLYDMEDLRGLVDEKEEKRVEEFEKAERIVDDELEKLVDELKKLEVDEVIKNIYKKVEEIKEEEIEEALRALKCRKGDVDEDDREVIRNLTHSVTNKILHDPVSGINRASSEGRKSIIRSAEYLFNVENN